MSEQNKVKTIDKAKKFRPLEAFNNVGNAKFELVENRTQKQSEVIKKKEIIKIETLVKSK